MRLRRIGKGGKSPPLHPPGQAARISGAMTSFRTASTVWLVHQRSGRFRACRHLTPSND